MLSIVSGIIIDAFGASRDHRNDVTADQEGACFICRCVPASSSCASCHATATHISTLRWACTNSACTASLEASKFERLGRGFEYHCRWEHNMWNYVALDSYLHLKHETSFTGLETFVRDAARHGGLNYFPIGRASSVSHAHGHAGEDGGASGNDGALRL